MVFANIGLQDLNWRSFSQQAGPPGLGNKHSMWTLTMNNACTVQNITNSLDVIDLQSDFHVSDFYFVSLLHNVSCSNGGDAGVLISVQNFKNE